MYLKNEKGITMIALVITVIVLTVIGAFSLNIVNNSTKSSKDASNLSELRMVQQAILERYTKYTLTKDSAILVGNIISEDTKLPEQLEIFGQMQYTNGILEEDRYEEGYYILYNYTNNSNKSQYFKELDIENTSNVYIVNYYTGEVMQLETEMVKNGSQNGEYIIGEFKGEDPIDDKYLILKEDKNGRYIIKETSEGDLLYTYTNNISQ